MKYIDVSQRFKTITTLGLRILFMRATPIQIAIETNKGITTSSLYGKKTVTAIEDYNKEVFDVLPMIMSFA